ncbi:MAG: iron-only hydrogenase system regulator [Candidatus Omnitrophica bacterium]|jgi:putative iron-only hydrogenase system regulator|nr:iron-only hydrogenase system regulator [Candidatus Omnitrophota bacterium]
MANTDKRLGFIGIIVEDRKKNAPRVNEILSGYGDIILARMGVPSGKKGLNVITLVVDATTDELGALTGKLGKIAGISVKSSLSKPYAGGRDAQDA